MATSADKEPGCTADFDRGPGSYPLGVMLEHDDAQNSYNKFSFRVTSSGPAPSIFGLGDMSVYANADSGSSTEIFLADVMPPHAGKDLIIELFDVGDISGGSGGDQLEFYDGSDTLVSCSWESDEGIRVVGAFHHQRSEQAVQRRAAHHHRPYSAQLQLHRDRLAVQAQVRVHRRRKRHHHLDGVRRWEPDPDH
jgi:hypothetical protein